MENTMIPMENTIIPTDDRNGEDDHSGEGGDHNGENDHSGEGDDHNGEDDHSGEGDDHSGEERADHNDEKQDNHSGEQDDLLNNYNNHIEKEEDNHNGDERDNHRRKEHDNNNGEEQSNNNEEQDNHSDEDQSNHSSTEPDHWEIKRRSNSSVEKDEHNTTEHDTLSPASKRKKPLVTLMKHKRVREKADICYRKNAERMRHKHSLTHKINKFAVGESVGLRIPRIDRTATDVPRLPCVIVKVTGKMLDLYRLRCCFGVLDKCYRADELEPFAGNYNIPVNGWEKEVRISLREAARCHSPWNVFTGNKCNCSSGSCDTRRCCCKKKGVSCSSHCHKGTHCKNKEHHDRLGVKYMSICI